MLHVKKEKPVETKAKKKVEKKAAPEVPPLPEEKKKEMTELERLEAELGEIEGRLTKLT